MTEDLKQLLEVAVRSDRPPVDLGAVLTADLDRARRAARSRMQRRFRAGTASLALVATAVVGIGYAVNQPSSGSSGPVAGSSPGGSRGASDVRLVDAPFDAAPYTFDLTPKGWSVQSQNADRVTIAPDDGSTSTNPDDFQGKLVIMFDENPPSGRRVVAGGRVFWIGGDSGYTIMATRTLDDEPGGEVLVQYPNDAGWTRETMLEFLGSVHVGPGARPGLG